MKDANAWSRGYPVSEPYPSSWHAFQSPAHLRLVCALMGVAWEVGPQTPLSIAEVGCGTGYTAHMLAAGNPHWRVIGLDYNPAHVAEARSFAAAAGLDNLRFLDLDLAEMGDDDADRLPEFDLITVHGVWSWVADAVREGVLRLLRRRLKPGGLVLMTYNALPGAAAALGLSKLVRRSLLDAGPSDQGLLAASQLVQKLVAAESAHLGQSTWRRLLTDKFQEAQPGYLLHEFQTEHWRPCFHQDVVAALGQVRCEYVGSATLSENFAQMSLSPAQRELWDATPDATARELIFDLCVPRAFRRDVFVRGMRRVSGDAAVDATWLVSATRVEGEVVLRSQAGEAQLPKAMVDAARSALSQGPCSVAELRALPGCGSATPAELATLMVGSGCAMPLWRQPGAGAEWEEAVAAARRFNAVAASRLAPHGVGTGNLGLASPCLAGGLVAKPMELALACLVAASPDLVLGGNAAATLVHRLLPPGRVPPPELLTELEREVAALLRDRLPVWQAMGVV